MFQEGIIHDLHQDYSYSLTGFLFFSGRRLSLSSAGLVLKKAPAVSPGEG